MTEILWLEGKLVGTPLQAPHDQYRAEGELRLGIALAMPLATAAVGYAITMDKLAFFTSMAVTGILALKLAQYGFYYFRRAHSFLAHHVSDGTVLTPSMEYIKSQNSSDHIKLLVQSKP